MSFGLVKRAQCWSKCSVAGEMELTHTHTHTHNTYTHTHTYYVRKTKNQ